MIIKSCKNCQKVFKIWPFRVREGNGKYCSRICAGFGKWKKPTQKMLSHIRMAQKLAAKSRIGLKHTELSIKKISDSRKGKALGKKNSRWRGGISDLRISIHGLPEYNLWRKSIFKKNSYTCQKCGVKSGSGKRVYLEADHYPIPFRDLINGIKTAQEARTVERLWKANGRTLCRPCHDKTKVFISNQYGGRKKI